VILLPAIDLRGGKCVRLHQGDYAQETIYGEDPVAVAQGFVDAGAGWIHVVDLDGARSGKPEHLDVLSKIAKLGVNIETGGGIRSLETIDQVLEAGIARAILGSILVKDRELAEDAFQRFGSNLIAGLDVREEKVAVSGWQEQTELDLYETASWLIDLGCERFIVTDIATDGTLKGPNLDLANKFLDKFHTNYIISGGVGQMADLVAAKATSAEGIIAGKAIYDGRIDVGEALRLFDDASPTMQPK
jgi:phosphoribosylformimino-5-aminoimidazole carboxamide ribotide isomerase